MITFRLVIIAAAFGIAPPLVAQDWASTQTFGGAWDTNWGETWVNPTSFGYEGTYTEDNGRFWVEFTDHIYEGYWAEDLSGERCDVEYMGSYYWGRLQLSDASTFPGIQMLWGYCRDGRVDKQWQFTERLPDGL